MPQAAPQFPAVMVLRERGEILFQDRRACELTGYGIGEHRDLWELLTSLFPEGRDQLNAVRLFRRAAATAGRRGTARFQAEFASKHGRLRRTIVQVQRWGGVPGDRSYLVSFLPLETQGMIPPVEDRTIVFQAMARRVARLLTGAAAYSRTMAVGADTSEEQFGTLSALIERAQGLLGSLEGQAQGESLGDGEGRE